MQASVVVPTHRGAHRLPDLLDAMARQDFDGPWELIVVVDGVVDDSPAILESYRDHLPLRTIVHETSQGVVAVLNDAFSTATGDVLIRCDDDLTPGPSFVSRHVSHHAGRTDVGVIGPTRDVFPETPYARVYGRPATERSLSAAYARPEQDRWIGWAANNSIHRQAWTCSGGFDPRFVYGQDSELGWRLVHDCKVTLIVDRELQVDHRGPSTRAATRIPRAFVSGASKRLFYRVHPEPSRASSPRGGVKDRVWRAGVLGLSSTVTTKPGYERVGRVLDRLLDFGSGQLGARLTALCVEAAGASGLRHGVDDLTVYKAQKSAELALELGRTT
ncbi:glycosyltransferase family 2 protein [Nocardioides sp.]|uniref:glycosyltransferase family 2 protein n=1 Tax=Nocardioides sp. TaxID=35761 RepID=UPI002D0A36C5|nr:glycosyltransferase [Nocardioides sp.]HXH77210.1 glycosyltransferase [Nocardioides sp.]